MKIIWGLAFFGKNLCGEILLGSSENPNLFAPQGTQSYAERNKGFLGFGSVLTHKGIFLLSSAALCDLCGEKDLGVGFVFGSTQNLFLKEVSFWNPSATF